MRCLKSLAQLFKHDLPCHSLNMMPLEFLQSILQAIWRGALDLLNRLGSPRSSILPRTDAPDAQAPYRSLASLANEIDRVFRHPCSMRRMLGMSTMMKRQYKDKLLDSDACMLPSFCHSLPTGHETGNLVAVDVGGSTCRIALVELRGRLNPDEAMIIHNITTTRIDESTRRLQGQQFFDWMATRIREMLSTDADTRLQGQAVPVGLTWSFPLEQTSHRSGKMQAMGKGFKAAEGTLGMDMAHLLESACTRQGMTVAVEAIVNDGAATLLSQAYLDPATSMGLILGTGTNAAVYLPTAALGRRKFGQRDAAWHDRANRVIVNTEFSMFGKAVLPQTRWDDILNRTHPLPDFQPLEYMTTGRYLGELLRLIILEAVETCGLFGGIMPMSLTEAYTLDTAIMAQLECDNSASAEASMKTLSDAWSMKLTPTSDEIAFLRMATKSIAHRASAYLSVAIHALWTLQKESEVNHHTLSGIRKTSIACNGSVILKYPGFKDNCEKNIAGMIAEASSLGTGVPVEKVVLEATNEAALFGAAVAVALAGKP